MRLKNKKTGEIGNLLYKPDNEEEHFVVVTPCPGDMGIYKTLDELAEEWTDYEGPKEYWYIDPMVCGVYCTKIKKDEDLYNFNKQIGNDFETEEKAEKAVLRLKALERLRKNGFKFDGFRQDYTRWSLGQDAFRDGKRYIHFNKADDDDWLKENWKDLKLVFEEEE